MPKDTEDIKDETRDEVEDMNEDDDSREEDVVEDVDADTKDVTEKEDEIQGSDSAIMGIIKELRDKMDRIEGDVLAIRDAQSVMITDARIIENDTPNYSGDTVDNFVPITELDFTI